MAKEFTGVRLERHTHRALKKLSTRWGKPLGDIIDGLTKFADRGQDPEKYFKDPAFCDLIKTTFENCMINAGMKAAWVADNVEELIDQFENVISLANQVGDSLTAKQFEAKIKALKEEHGLIDKI